MNRQTEERDYIVEHTWNRGDNHTTRIGKGEREYNYTINSVSPRARTNSIPSEKDFWSEQPDETVEAEKLNDGERGFIINIVLQTKYMKSKKELDSKMWRDSKRRWRNAEEWRKKNVVVIERTSRQTDRCPFDRLHHRPHHPFGNPAIHHITRNWQMNIHDGRTTTWMN